VNRVNSSVWRSDQSQRSRRREKLVRIVKVLKQALTAAHPPPSQTGTGSLGLGSKNHIIDFLIDKLAELTRAARPADGS
jgi:hypothetical protein